MSARLWLFALLLLFVPLAPASAMPPAQPPPAAAAAPAESFEAAAATRAYLDTVPAAKRAKSDAYFEGTYWLILWNFLLGSAISLLLLQTRWSARLRTFAAGQGRPLFLQVVIYGALYVLLTSVLSFPMTVYTDFFREHQYGLATQTFGPWFKEQLIGLAVALLAMPLALAGLYAAFRRAQRAWWVAGSLVSVALMMFALLVAPVFVEPLFNKYTPVADPAVSEPILAMARANQIPVRDVLQFDASKQTNRVSANVSGFAGTTRIALNDNLLNRCSLPEVRMVMAHEMGHYVLNHIGKTVVFFGVLLIAGFWFVDRTFELIRTRWGANWGVEGIADPAGLPLLLLLLGVFFFVITPIKNTIIRSSESEADAFGLNVSREPDGFAQCALKLGDYRKLDPGYWEEIIFFDHPSGRARIRMAMDWKAEQLKGRQ